MKSSSDRIRDLKPHLLHELETNILNYWLTKTPDPINGGYYGHIDENNNPLPGASRGAVLNARILWTFSAAAGFLKNNDYALQADRAFQYFSTSFTDEKYGGIFWETDYLGRVKNPRKQIYAQAFGIYAYAEYYRLTGNQEALRQAIELFQLIEKHSYDAANEGYIEAFQEDWTTISDLRLSEKDLNAPKTMNTHLHILEAYTNLYKVWKDPELKYSLERIIRLFLTRFIDNRDHLILFFDMDWIRIGQVCSYGHDIEFSWLLTEAAVISGNSELINECGEKALRVAAKVFREGLDKDGGLMNEYDYERGEMDTDKHWWQQAEAMVGFLNAYHISKDEKYLGVIPSIWNFITRYMIDHKNGEWFWKTDRKGTVYSGMEKAGFWKCPYHNSRALMEILERTSHT